MSDTECKKNINDYFPAFLLVSESPESSDRETNSDNLETVAQQDEDNNPVDPVLSEGEQDNPYYADSTFGSEASEGRSSATDEINDDLETRLVNTFKVDNGSHPERRLEILAALHSNSIRDHYNGPTQYTRDTVNQSSCMIDSYNKANEGNIRLQVGINPETKTVIYQGFKMDEQGNERLIYSDKNLGLTPNLNIFENEDIGTHRTILGSIERIQQDDRDYPYLLNSEVELTGELTLHKGDIDSDLPEDDTYIDLTEQERFFEISFDDTEINSPQNLPEEAPENITGTTTENPNQSLYGSIPERIKIKTSESELGNDFDVPFRRTGISLEDILNSGQSEVQENSSVEQQMEQEPGQREQQGIEQVQNLPEQNSPDPASQIPESSTSAKRKRSESDLDEQSEDLPTKRRLLESSMDWEQNENQLDDSIGQEQQQSLPEQNSPDPASQVPESSTGAKRKRSESDLDEQLENSPKRKKSKSDSDSDSDSDSGNPSGGVSGGISGGPSTESGPQNTSETQTNFKDLNLKEIIIITLSHVANILDTFIEMLL